MSFASSRAWHSARNALSEDEIIRIYGMRWNIETFFKASKSLLKLGREFQTRSYDSAVAHTAIVFARYTFLEWLRRQENDPKTYGILSLVWQLKGIIIL